jgi:hypothetical protein
MQLFAAAGQLVDQHFQPALAALRTVGALETLDGPVMNVLRKAFQSKHQEILIMIDRGDLISRKVEVLVD